MKSRTLAAFFSFALISAAVLGYAATAHAAAMENMKGMTGMNSTSSTSTMTMSGTIPISMITQMNSSAEIDAAVSMHEASMGDATGSSMMSMTAGPYASMSTTTTEILSAIDLRGETFWLAGIILFALVFAASLYVFLKRGVGKWFAIAALALALISGACLIVFLQTSFPLECTGDGNEWGEMQPSVAGEALSQASAEGCIWGMGNYMYMFSDQQEYTYYENLTPATVTLATAPQDLVASVPTTLTVSLKNADGTPATLFVDMDKVLHVVIISKDETVYAHIHPDDAHPLTAQEIDTSTFTVNYTFPKSGDYMVAFDYAHGLTLESKQFIVHVAGGPPQNAAVTEYPSTDTFTVLNDAKQKAGMYEIAPNIAQGLALNTKQSIVEVAQNSSSGTFDGYDVSLTYELPLAGQIETLYYTITKDGKPVTFVPYLDAAMHVSVVKNDFSWYLHVHGEVHPPGIPIPPLIIKNGQVLHTMAMMVTPSVFTLPIEAHLIFPTAGMYTVWGQFKTQSGDLVATAFTVQVEQ